MPDDLTNEQRTRCMKHIKSKNTKIEILLRKELWSRGIRYRINVQSIPGKPDIAFIGKKVAVFCDSEFFHGKDWEGYLLPKLKNSHNSDFWIRKIQRNIERDNEVNEMLKSMGWTVIRFWGKDILRNPCTCVDLIVECLNK